MRNIIFTTVPPNPTWAWEMLQLPDPHLPSKQLLPMVVYMTGMYDHLDVTLSFVTRKRSCAINEEDVYCTALHDDARWSTRSIMECYYSWIPQNLGRIQSILSGWFFRIFNQSSQLLREDQTTYDIVNYEREDTRAISKILVFSNNHNTPPSVSYSVQYWSPASANPISHWSSRGQPHPKQYE